MDDTVPTALILMAVAVALILTAVCGDSVE